MTWDAYHRRKTVLREMLAQADAQRDVTLTDLLETVEGAHDAFPTTESALFELQMIWFQRLSGHMDRLLADEQEAPALVPVTAWVDTAGDLPGARALLDAHLDEPALRKAFSKELSYLALASGLPVQGAAATARGREIRDSAREELAARPVAPVRDAAQTRIGLIARLRSVIAA